MQACVGKAWMIIKYGENPQQRTELTQSWLPVSGATVLVLCLSCPVLLGAVADSGVMDGLSAVG